MVAVIQQSQSNKVPNAQKNIQLGSADALSRCYSFDTKNDRSFENLYLLSTFSDIIQAEASVVLRFLKYFLLSIKVILPLIAFSIEDIFLIIIFDFPISLSSVKPASFFKENGPFGFNIIFLINFFFFFLFYCNFW